MLNNMAKVSMIITSQTCINEDGLAKYRINQTTSGLEFHSNNEGTHCRT